MPNAKIYCIYFIKIIEAAQLSNQCVANERTFSATLNSTALTHNPNSDI